MADRWQKVRLNARGYIFEIPLESFQKYPKDSRLGKLVNFDEMTVEEILECCDKYNSEKTEFYFNRSPYVLNMVLDYFVSGKLHNSNTTMCQVYLEKELSYWMIDTNDMKRCCHVEYENNYNSRNEEIIFEKKVLKEISKASSQLEKSETRRKLWAIIENPNSSNVARVS